MKVERGFYLGDPSVTVRLSERNINTLVALWDAAQKGEALPVLHRYDGSEGTFLTVLIEADEIHYNGSRPRGIGPEDVS